MFSALFPKRDLTEDEEPGQAVRMDPQAHDGHTKTAEERRYLRKLDAFLLTFTCIS